MVLAPGPKRSLETGFGDMGLNEAVVWAPSGEPWRSSWRVSRSVSTSRRMVWCGSMASGDPSRAKLEEQT